MEKTFKQPDLKAPRYRVERLTNLNLAFYKRFIKKFPKYKHLTQKEVNNIIKTFNRNIWKNVIIERDGVELPEGLGYLFVGSCPAAVKKNNINKKVSEEYKLQIKHRNFESDSFIAKIFYTNYANKYKFKLRQVWMFKGCREFTREVSAEYRERWKSYIQVDSYMHINKLYNKYKVKDLAIKYTAKPTEDYNEFAID